MFNGSAVIYSISFLAFLFSVTLVITVRQIFNDKRTRVIKRLRGVHVIKQKQEEDLLRKPFLERTLGEIAKWLNSIISQITPFKLKEDIENKLAKAGSPKNITAIDLLTTQAIIGATVFMLFWFGLSKLDLSVGKGISLALPVSFLTAYLPMFILATKVTQFQKQFQRSLPDIMDLLVISVEAGLGFDMALQKVVERFPGGVAKEFKNIQKEMQLGRSRKEALKAMAERIDLPELSTLINAIIQSEQLGVGLGNVLRLQSDLIREKRQQYIEEQAMKAPIKMLIPLVLFIFPCIFIIILGPAMLNIMRSLGN